MDIVGPLPHSRAGHKYILVTCDYATRYPDAIPLRSIDAEHIADELVKLFSRVGIPKEILTDQGSNFTSQLLTEIYRLLHVHRIRTTPYHPQSDGLVERFNKTLKSLLRKTVTDTGKDWDKLLPFLLFAYREVPQASTGFSPFELLYGREVRGPLDVLKETWEADKRSSESVVSHVLAMRDRMSSMTELVRKQLEKAQEKQKLWYDKAARERVQTRRPGPGTPSHKRKQIVGKMARTVSSHTPCGKGDVHDRHAQHPKEETKPTRLHASSVACTDRCFLLH